MAAQVPDLFETPTGGQQTGDLMTHLRVLDTPSASTAARDRTAPPGMETEQAELGAAAVSAVAALLFLSGAAGLIYQVAWVRLLGLAFGVTIFAISTVLAAFMGGLAIGSFVGGRRADRVGQPLRAYGLVEVGVGCTALLTPWAFGLLQSVYSSLSQVVDPAQAPLFAGSIRGVLLFAVLLVPTALMGATLPLAVRGVRATTREVDATRGDAWAMGLLYAANTAGAIVGCLLSGFVLIARLGLAETIVVAAMANGVAGIGAFWLARNLSNRRHNVASPRAASQIPRGEVLARTAFWAFAISGFISLAYEVVWSRILAVLFDSSIYGFVLMLATVLFGIAAGGALGGLLVRWQAGARVAGLAFGWLELGIGLAAVLAVIAFAGAYDALIRIRDEGPTFLAVWVRTDLRLMAGLCVVTVLPAALLMGATFPVAARLWAAGSGGLGQRLGGVYGGNVAGAIFGSLAGGFLLVPLLGAHHSLLVLAAANVMLGALLLSVVGQRTVALLAGAAALGVVAASATWPPLHRVVFNQRFSDQQLLSYWEGLENTVSVGRDASGIQTLFTNSRGQTNDSADLVRYHRVIGHLGALLAPSRTPHALVIGLGGGATPGALAQHSGTRLDLIELSESVLAAAPFFRVANADVLQQPNVRVLVDDGRNYLLRTQQTYDIITADIIPPYDAGATNLYSVEYFKLAARSLTPNGVMMQWVLPGTAFQHALIVRTFLQAFPNSTLWLADDLLIGSPSPLRISRAELEARLADPSARAALAEIGFNKTQDVVFHFRAGPEVLHAYAGEGPVLTDNHPILEYFRSHDLPGDPLDLSRFRDQPPLTD